MSEESRRRTARLVLEALAGTDFVLTGASALLGESVPAWRRPLIRAGVQRTAQLLRWGVADNSAAQRARRRLLTTGPAEPPMRP